MRIEIDGVLFEINYRRLGPTARMVLRDIEAQARLLMTAGTAPITPAVVSERATNPAE